MRKAFTLIELLVVIAIIAILAAILFPVFAQAREAAKKTQAITNAKQQGTSMILYTTDSDDICPFAIPPNSANGTWRFSAYNLAPQDAFTGINPDFQLHWGNSIFPYSKNADILEGPGMKKVDALTEIPTLVKVAGKRGFTNSLNMNGNLHNYPLSSVERPSKLAMFWNGQGKFNFVGITDSIPVPNCSGTVGGPCVFTPGSAPMAGASTAYAGDIWWAYGAPAAAQSGQYIWGRAFVQVNTDSSVKVTKIIGPTGTGFTNQVYNQPFRSINGNAGIPVSRWVCGSALANAYWCYFRPDANFEE